MLLCTVIPMKVLLLIRACERSNKPKASQLFTSLVITDTETSRQDARCTATVGRRVQEDREDKFHGNMVSFKGGGQKNAGSWVGRIHCISDLNEWGGERSLQGSCCIWLMPGRSEPTSQGMYVCMYVCM